VPLKGELERHEKTPALFLKLPPEDSDRSPWSRESLEPILAPLLDARACDGFVAVNTSMRLAQELLHQDNGGVSGKPLLPLASATIQLLRSMVGPQPLILGGGGIMTPADALSLQDAGAELVELYSGMIYAGPDLPGACARALALRRAEKSVPSPATQQLVS
jgi:dihydroorotate dehydrogenase